jgi:glycosyltransferase involved in cell wall biosynthesis
LSNLRFFYFTDIFKTDLSSQGLTVDLFFYGKKPELIADYPLKTDQIYFFTEKLYKHFINMLIKSNNMGILKPLPTKQVFARFLNNKNIADLNNTDKPFIGKIELRVALLLDIDFDLKNTVLKEQMITKINSFAKQLNQYYKNVFIDLFTINIADIISDYLPELQIDDCYRLGQSLDALYHYDLFLDLSDYIKDNKLQVDTVINNFIAKFDPEKQIKINAKSMKNELVSVIIPTFNRAGHLPEAIKSVLNQTHKAIEIIIVNDGSTDNTADVAADFCRSYPFIKYVYKENGGIASARNVGIEHSHGNYLMFLDDDDQYLPFALEVLLNSFNKQPDNVMFIYGEAISYNSKITKKTLQVGLNLFSRPELYYQTLQTNHLQTPGQAMIRKKPLIEIGMFNPDFKLCEDYELFTRVVLNYDLRKIDIPVILYSEHEGQSVKNQGLIRYYTDKACIKFLWQLKKMNLLEFRDISKEASAIRMQNLARNMLNTYWTHYDAVLDLLNIAQETFYSEQRQNYINELEKNIPVLIQQRYHSDLRVSPEEKNSLKI